MLERVMQKQPGSIRFQDMQRRFDRAAASFDSVDFVHRKTATGLIERLEPVVIDAGTILDLGGATGTASRDLRRRFRGSRVIVLDADRISG